MRRVVLLVLTVLFVSPVLAAPDAHSGWRKERKAFQRREASWWEEFGPRLTGIYMDWTGKRRLWRSDPETYKDEVVPLDDLRDLVEEYVELQEVAVEPDRMLALSGHAKTWPTLFKELLHQAKDIDRLEKELDQARPSGGGSRYELEPSLRRLGHEIRLQGLVRALAATPDAVSHIASEGLDKAAKLDKKKSTVRRAALVDVLAMVPGEESGALLGAVTQDEAPFVRIAAIEGLVPHGASGVEAVAGLLHDPAPQVRRALLETVGKARVVAWIPPLIDHLPQTAGLERELLLRALRALTGKAFDEPETDWPVWFEKNKAAIADGSFEAPVPVAEEKKEEEEEEPAEPPEYVAPVLLSEAGLRFYGFPVPGSRPIFIVSGGTDTALPAELKTQRRFSKRHWQQTGPKWRQVDPDHKSMLLEQLEKTLAPKDSGLRFGLIHLYGSTPSRVGIYGGRSLLEPSKSCVKSLLHKIAKPPSAGQMSVEEGLRRVGSLSRLDPFENPKDADETAEVLILHDTGWNGGRWPLPELLIQAYARDYRFHRLPVYAIRICDEKAEADALMRGLAEVSGGAYLWLESLP